MQRSAGVLRLLSHDLRIAWRDVRSAFRMFGTASFIGLCLTVALIMHAAAWSALAWIHGPGGPDGGAPLGFGVVFVLLLLLAQSLNNATKALHGRGDLDLLCSAPISPRKLLAVRALAMAVEAAASAAIFVVPLANVGLLAGDPRWLAAYPALAAGALLAVAIGLAVTVGLFALVGPRRARLGAQILATFIGGGFVLSIQLDRMLPAGIFSHLGVVDRVGLWFDRHRAAVELPVRALEGDVTALLLWCGIGLAAFAAMAIGLGPVFLRQAMAASAADRAQPPRTRMARGGAVRFSGSLGQGLRRKEWRIIRRDPWIVSQVLLQILYLAPLFLILSQRGPLAASPSLALAPTIVVVCFQLAGSLTWLGLSGEDAPELLQTAPVTRAALNRGKVAAVAGLTAAIAALPFCCLMWLAPQAALPVAGLACFGGGAAVLLHLAHTRPTRRSSFAARHRESKLLALIEMAISTLLGIATALAVVRSPWFVVPLAVVGIVLLCNRPRRSLA